MKQSDVEKIKARALRAISPLKQADSETRAPKGLLFNARRTEAGRSLPAYFLVYFLLVDLLGFRNLGQFEKVAWSVPVDLEGQAYLIEHRKFGLGVFASNLPDDEKAAAEVVKLVQKATKAAQPYFEWRAQQAAMASKLNVLNRSPELYERLEFHLDLYEGRQQEAEARFRGQRVSRV